MAAVCQETAAADVAVGWRQNVVAEGKTCLATVWSPDEATGWRQSVAAEGSKNVAEIWN